MPRYKKKAITIDATQWNPPDENGKVRKAMECTDHSAVTPASRRQIIDLLGTAGRGMTPPYWDWTEMGIINTLEGKHVVSPGDWIITGVKGEVYPCKPDVFQELYELDA